MALFMPSLDLCLGVIVPVASVWAVIWFSRHGDQVIQRLFPHWEWERQLGWLNIRVNRRVETIMRGLQHLVHAFLALDLLAFLGVAWLAGQKHDMDTRIGVFSLALEFAYMIVFLSPCLYYFIVILGPRLIAEYEEELLARYREENPEEDENERPGRQTDPKITVWGATRTYRRF